MAYDLLIKNGRIVDGSGMPAFRGDVGVKNGTPPDCKTLDDPNAREAETGMGRELAGLDSGD